MTKISFKVSARTARLIGQENFSNPEGAVIELVKNCYDADAKNCLIVYDIKFASIPEVLTLKQFKEFSEQNKIVKTTYRLKTGKYYLTRNLDKDRALKLTSFFLSFNSIYIIDNGDGMTKSTIENDWMEIGTGNKQEKYASNDGRIKTGAKGIGRFALDRLGHFTQMWTYSKNNRNNIGIYWSMNWRQFEVLNKSISEIEADFTETHFNFKSFIQNQFKDNSQIQTFLKSASFTHGTIIKISQLKDTWSDDALQSVYKNLESLIPPEELDVAFNVNFYLLQKTKLFGKVETAYFNDFDYKVFAKFNSQNLSVNLDITRNELDLKKVKKDYEYIFKKSKHPYDLKTLIKKEFKVNKSAYEILKWHETQDNEIILKRLGDFSFSFYFLKNNIQKKEIYPYKGINSKERKAIINRFGGVKIYRDSFRVRPYGDIANDWLKLGERAASSPAGAGQRIGDWRVNPYQIAGLISISRFGNPDLIDKSDRGGLQENESFDTLQKFIKGILYEFEFDRSKILNPFFEDDKKKKLEEREKRIKEEAERLADKIVLERQKVEKEIYGTSPDLFKSLKTQAEREAYEKIIAKGLQKFDKKDDEGAEIAQIRTLASLGLIVTSFSHELKEAKNNYTDIEKLERIFDKIVPDEKKESVDYIDGINIFELLKIENQKIAHWVDYALTAIKKDKRKRGPINFEKFFDDLIKKWSNVLDTSHIRIEIKNKISKEYTFKAFEMDMYTIFNNLISNSIDAINDLEVIRARKISITISLVKEKIQIIYSDTGTGLSKIFKKDKEEIFLPFITTKKNGDGTGLGMYLVKNVILDNNGSVEILDSLAGFKLKIEFPSSNK